MNSVNCTANIVPHTLPQAALKVVQCAALIAPYVFCQSAGTVLPSAIPRYQGNKGGDRPPTLLMSPLYIAARLSGAA